MKHFGTLTRVRMRLAMRNRVFIFFSLVMPLAFFFFFAGIIAKGESRWVAYFLAPIIAMTVMGSFWGQSAVLVMFREQGILRRFRLAPISASDMLASSIAANYILMLPTVIIEILLARWLFHVRDFGNLLSLFVLVTVATVSFAALGLTIASVTNTMQETQVICQIIWLLLIFLSGATFPLPHLPRVVQHLALFLPATYLVVGLHRAMIGAVAVWHLQIELFSLAAWAVLAFFISTQLFRWEPEEKVTRSAKAWAAATILPFLLLGVWESKYGKLQSEARSTFDAVTRTSPDSNAPR